jgi:hypothetical protein
MTQKEGKTGPFYDASTSNNSINKIIEDLCKKNGTESSSIGRES